MSTTAQDETLGSVEELRLELNNDQSLDEGVLKRKLESARVDVDSEAQGSPSEAQLKEAVLAFAAYDIASLDRLVSQKSASDESISWDTVTFREGVKADKEQAKENIMEFWAVTL